MEALISQLLLPDNEAIKRATKRLQELYNDPQVVLALSDVLKTSPSREVRQYAAVILRKRVMKRKQWGKISNDVKQRLKQDILVMTLQETESIVQKSLAEVVAALAKHELPGNSWPEFLEFLQQFNTSDQIKNREIGMQVLSITSSVASEQLSVHITALLELFKHTIADQGSLLVRYYTIQCLSNMVFQVGSEDLVKFQGLIPSALDAVICLLKVDEEKACDALELFDELLECEVSILVPYIKAMVQFCLETAANVSLDDNIRIKVMSLITALIKQKKKAILKHKLIEVIIETMFGVMCHHSDEDDDETGDDAASSSRPNDVAAQVIDTLALHVPPDKVIPKVLLHVEAALASPDPQLRKSAYVSLAVCAEGCGDYIRNKYLKAFLELVCKGVSDQNQRVSTAAMYAMGQFAEHLQPDISKYSSEVIPLLFHYLNKVTRGDGMESNRKTITKTYYAIEMICENLEAEILPHLPMLMDHFLTVLNSSNSLRHKELSISGIGAVASAARKGIVPYFLQIVEYFKQYLSRTDDEDCLAVQIQTLDTIGVLARTVGLEHFQPIAKDCVELGLNLVSNQTDPDLHRCVYGLLAALSSIMKASLEPYLKQIVQHIIESLQSSDGITTHYEEDAGMFNFVDEDDIEGDSDTADEDDDAIQGVSIANSYLEEKQDACLAIGEIAANSGLLFLPYMEVVFQEVLSMANYPASVVKKGSITALGQLCSVTANDLKNNPESNLQSAHKTMIASTLNKYCQIIRKDSDRGVVIATLETLGDVLTKTKGLPIDREQSEPVAVCVMEVLQKSTNCQDQSVDEGDGDDQEAEYDSILIENAGDVIPALGGVVSGQDFNKYCQLFIPELLKRMKPRSSVSDKSFAVGCLAETIDVLQSWVKPFVGDVYPRLLASIQADDGEVRSNTVFAIGVLAVCGKEEMYSKYPEILKALFALLAIEQNRRVVDNICGAVCRLICTNLGLVPLSEVLPVVIQCLPLGEDFEENRTVFMCLSSLFSAGCHLVLNYMPQILSVVGKVIETDQITSETKLVLVNMIEQLYMRNPDELNAIITSLPEDSQSSIQKFYPVS